MYWKDNKHSLYIKSKIIGLISCNKGVGGKEVIKLEAKVLCLAKATPKIDNVMEDMKPEPVEKKSISAPSPGDRDVDKVPQEELENKANEDLAIVDQVSTII